MTLASDPFWQRKSLSQMTPGEWEALCDGCAKCCLVRLEDADTGEVALTNVACRLLNIETCRCRDYPRRTELVAGCTALTAQSVGELAWIPKTCAYRLLLEGRNLPPWHPLLAGEGDDAVDGLGAIRALIVPEQEVPDEELIDHIIKWEP